MLTGCYRCQSLLFYMTPTEICCLCKTVCLRSHSMLIQDLELILCSYNYLSQLKSWSSSSQQIHVKFLINCESQEVLFFLHKLCLSRSYAFTTINNVCVSTENKENSLHGGVALWYMLFISKSIQLSLRSKVLEA